MLREMGHFHLQAFAILTMPAENYECSYLEPGDKLIQKTCTQREVCLMQDESYYPGISNFTFSPNTQNENYLNNWLT